MLSFPLPVSISHAVFWKTCTLLSIVCGSIITPNAAFWRSMQIFPFLWLAVLIFDVSGAGHRQVCVEALKEDTFSMSRWCSHICLSFHWTPMTPGLAVIRIFHKVSHVVPLLPSTNSCLCSSSAWVIGPSGSHKKQTSCWWRTVYWMILYHVSALGIMSMNQIHTGFP